MTSQKQVVELNVSPGVYLVHVNDGSKTYLEKITIH